MEYIETPDGMTLHGCPFCYLPESEGMQKVVRQEDTLGLHFYVVCRRCGAMTGNYASAQEATKTWNGAEQFLVTTSHCRSAGEAMRRSMQEVLDRPLKQRQVPVLTDVERERDDLRNALGAVVGEHPDVVIRHRGVCGGWEWAVPGKQLHYGYASPQAAYKAYKERFVPMVGISGKEGEKTDGQG